MLSLAYKHVRSQQTTIQHGPLYIGYIFAFMQQKWDQGTRGTQRSTLIGSWTCLDPSMDPCHGPTIHLTWPFIYWLYFCILCNKNGIKGLWGHKGQPSFVLGPALVLQWTLPWPYNTPDWALLDSETLAL